MPELSPAVRAVLAAMHRSYDHEPTRRAIAADVLEALADQVVPETPRPDLVYAGTMWEQRWEQRMASRRQILAIAAELRGEATTTEPQP